MHAIAERRRKFRPPNRSRRRLGAAIVAGLSALTMALSVGNAPQAQAQYPGPVPPQPPLNCDKPWVILSAYGTAEFTDAGHPYGTTGVNDTYIGALKTALGRNNVAAADIDVRNLNYPASAIDLPQWIIDLIGYDPGPDDYADSVRKGHDEAVKDLTFYANCPNKPTVIMLGYSQGAQVNKNAINDPAVTGNKSVSDAVGAIVNVGDASRSNSQIGMDQDGQMLTIDQGYNRVPSDVGRGGLMQRQDVPGVFAGFITSGRYYDVCRSDDLVCNESAYPGSDEWKNRWLQDFGNTAFGEDAPHIKYSTYTNNTSGTDREKAAAVASDVATKAVTAAVQQRNVVHPPPDTPEQVWATNVNVRAQPTTDAPIVTTIPEPTTVYVHCQEHAQLVTYGIYSNDAWSYLPQQGGWISNIFLTGPAWMPGVPDCNDLPGGPPASAAHR
ncbi:cutinase [Streptomyces sp. TLI_185]|nr:cutinase [Streptomyces sp. TLI_185]